MITNYDIDELFYASIKARFEMPQTPVSGIVYISGGVYNGDRPLNSKAEDITIRTISIVGDGFPQEAVTNVNVYVSDVAEFNGGYVRNGKRLEVLSNAVKDYIKTLIYKNVDINIDSMTEVNLESVGQHYMNIRMKVTVYENINQSN